MYFFYFCGELAGNSKEKQIFELLNNLNSIIYVVK